MWSLVIFRHFAGGRKALRLNALFGCALTEPNLQWFEPLLKYDDNHGQINLNVVVLFQKVLWFAYPMVRIARVASVIRPY